MSKVTIPIFFSVNDASAPLLATAIHSIQENASKEYQYHFHIYMDNLSRANKAKLSNLAGKDFQLSFHGLYGRLRLLSGGGSPSQRLYFPLFLLQFFPRYDKAIYLETDLVVTGDIANLYREPLGDKLIGAAADYNQSATTATPGVLLLNGKRIRENGFPKELKREDILFLDPNWHAIPSECVRYADDPQIIHFALAPKPWPDQSFPFGELFRKYAAGSGYAWEFGS